MNDWPRVGKHNDCKVLFVFPAVEFMDKYGYVFGHPKIKANITTKEIVDIIREGRES